MAIPKSKEKKMPLEKKEKLLDGVSLHCRNCDEDLEPKGVRVRPAGKDRYFLFCDTCDMHMKLISGGQSKKVPNSSPTSVSPKGNGNK